LSYLEEKYIKLACSGFRNYKTRSSRIFNFSCPVCGDSANNNRKARGFIYKKVDKWNYYCHNCNLSTSFYEFLKRINEPLYNDMILEKYRDQREEKKEIEVPSVDIENFFNTKVNAKMSDLALRIDVLPDTHKAKVYLKSRKIPEDKYDRMYYTGDINGLKKLFNNYDDVKFPAEDRLVIPVQDINKNLIGVVTRTLKDSYLRYINLRSDNDKPLIYGMDRIDFSKTKYVVEGPIDSFFIENSLAVAGVDLMKCADLLDDNTVYIFDNQPRNKFVVAAMRNMARMHKKIVVWPSNLKEKDINLMVLAGHDVMGLINKHTYKSLEASAYIGRWSKI
jgi:transcription elongation factor Elf1